MRLFLCIDGENVCALPYKSLQHISMTDLTARIPLHVPAKAARFSKPRLGEWRVLRNALHGKGIEGKLREVDMAPIIVPEGDMTRPIERENLFEVDLSSKWLPRLTIK